MSVENALYDRLRAVSAVETLIAGRIAPANVSPQRYAYPFITFERIPGEAHHAFGITLRAQTATYRLHCWAKLGAVAAAQQARELGAAVITALNGHSSSADGVLLFMLEDQFDGVSEVENIARRIVDFRVSHTANS